MMETEKGKHSERKKTGQLSGLQIMFAAILALGLILGINFTTLVASGQPLQELYQQVSSEITQLKQEQASLTQERDYARSDAYVARWAREEGKMILPGEVLVIPVPSNDSEAATPVPSEPPVSIETRPPEPQPWQLWWSLFFDSPPPKF